MKKMLVMLSPHNWYEHVIKQKNNRPLKLTEVFSNKDFFSIVLLINRVHPNRIFKSLKDERRVVKKGAFYRLLFDEKQNTYYLEHCLPFGSIERLILPKIIKKITLLLGDFKLYFWISDPKSTYLFSEIDAIKIFDAYDDWSLSPLFKEKKKHIKYIEKGYKNAEKFADYIFVNTEYMKKAYFNKRKNVYLLSNASSLSRATSNKKIKCNPNKRVIGYVGNIHSRINLDILEALLSEFEDMEVIFLGENNLDSLRFNKMILEYSNLKLLGSVKYEDLRHYINQFDVAIVPHIVDNYTLSQDSMKIYDYLACGQSVITTEISPSRNVPQDKGFIFVANSPNEFNSQVYEALRIGKNEEVKHKRIEYINNNDWLSKAKYVYSILQKE